MITNRRNKNNIVLVGVAGVGKTTLGQMAAEKLGLSFIDVDLSFEESESSDIDTLLKKYGDNRFDKLIDEHFITLIQNSDDTIFAAPARITQFKEFWNSVKLNGMSILLRGKPMEVYMRQDVWINGRKLSKKEKLKKSWKDDFYDYYYWRQRQC